MLSSLHAHGCRVLALAHRQLPSDFTAAAVRAMSREEAESQLQLAGFAVLQCPLKPESEPALAALAGAALNNLSFNDSIEHPQISREVRR